MSKKDSEVVRVLKEAKRLVRKGWTQHALATDADGISVLPTNPSAVKFCAWGAIDKANRTIILSRSCEWQALILLERAVAQRTHRNVDNVTLAGYNDNPRRTKADIISLYDLAIDLARNA